MQPGFSVLVLAAGGSTRLGRPKQLLEFQGEVLVGRAVRVARESGAAEVLVVTGAHAKEVECVLSETGACCVYNAGWSEGIGSSIACGMGSVTTDVLVIQLVDQPGITSDHLAALAARVNPETPIAVTGYGVAGLGAPCAFLSAEYLHLIALTGDRGAKAIWQGRSDLAIVPLAAASLDVDTEADYLQLISEGPGDR